MRWIVTVLPEEADEILHPLVGSWEVIPIPPGQPDKL
jgi:hypothetical protein